MGFISKFWLIDRRWSSRTFVDRRWSSRPAACLSAGRRWKQRPKRLETRGRGQKALFACLVVERPIQTQRNHQRWLYKRIFWELDYWHHPIQNIGCREFTFLPERLGLRIYLRGCQWKLLESDWGITSSLYKGKKVVILCIKGSPQL